VALLKKDTPEEAAAKEQRRREQAAAKTEEKRSKAFDNAWNAFWTSPVGRARAAYRNGDHVFQYSIDVMNQQAIIVAMVGSKTTSRTVDPTAILNAVCSEGWEIVSADFPFVMTGQQSRDKFLSSGQNVAIAGTVLGYYVFKRCDANHVDESDVELSQRLTSQVAGA
jgi:hypothetical protein